MTKVKPFWDVHTDDNNRHTRCVQWTKNNVDRLVKRQEYLNWFIITDRTLIQPINPCYNQFIVTLTNYY
jgi:hypothetical protein